MNTDYTNEAPRAHPPAMLRKALRAGPPAMLRKALRAGARGIFLFRPARQLAGGALRLTAKQSSSPSWRTGV